MATKYFGDSDEKKQTRETANARLKEESVAILKEFDKLQEDLLKIEDKIEELEDTADDVKSGLVSCPECNKEFIKLTKYIFKPACAHFPDNWVLSIG